MKPYYEDSHVTLYHGDCRNILPLLDPVDLVLTDPPYGIGESAAHNATRGRAGRAGDYGTDNWDTEPVDDATMRLVVAAARRAIIFGGNYYSLPPSTYWLVWDKLNGASHFADCELAWTNLPQAVRIRRHFWSGMMRKDREQRWHLTQKPLDVMRWCIVQADKHGTNAVILDPFAGSGTTLRAAKDLNRRAIGIELEEKYCEVAAKRMRQEVLPFDVPTNGAPQRVGSLFDKGSVP